VFFVMLLPPERASDGAAFEGRIGEKSHKTQELIPWLDRPA